MTEKERFLICPVCGEQTKEIKTETKSIQYPHMRKEMLHFALMPVFRCHSLKNVAKFDNKIKLSDVIETAIFQTLLFRGRKVA